MTQQKYYEISIVTPSGLCRGHVNASNVDSAIDRLYTAFGILNMPIEPTMLSSGRQSVRTFHTTYTGVVLNIRMEELDVIDNDPIGGR